MGIFNFFKKRKQESQVAEKTFTGDVFADKYPYGGEDISETIKKFNEDFGLEKFALPQGFRDFISTEKWHDFITDGASGFGTILYDKILDVAYDLIYGSDVFRLPPLCIPFGTGESGHEIYSLDYSQCGTNGEPQIIVTDDEKIDYEDNEDVSTYNFNKVIVSKSFKQFLATTEEK